MVVKQCIKNRLGNQNATQMHPEESLPQTPLLWNYLPVQEAVTLSADSPQPVQLDAQCYLPTATTIIISHLSIITAVVIMPLCVSLSLLRLLLSLSN